MVNDYIRRENMLNAVEKLDIIPSVDGMGIPTGAEDFRVQFLGTVLKVEPADVAPVVRCKDCTRYIDLRHWCKCHDTTMFENDFCSYGRKREE